VERVLEEDLNSQGAGYAWKPTGEGADPLPMVFTRQTGAGTARSAPTFTVNFNPVNGTVTVEKQLVSGKSFTGTVKVTSVEEDGSGVKAAVSAALQIAKLEEKKAAGGQHSQNRCADIWEVRNSRPD
jgi:hypothetical protein